MPVSLLNERIVQVDVFVTVTLGLDGGAQNNINELIASGAAKEVSGTYIS